MREFRVAVLVGFELKNLRNRAILMSQNTSVESSTQSLPNSSINPALQAALGSLDVQLEEELARYRRQRAGSPVMRPRGLGRHQIRKPIELISVSKLGGQTQTPVAGRNPAVPMLSFPLALVKPTPEAAFPQEIPREPITQAGLRETPVVAENSVTEDSVPTPMNPPEQPADVAGDLVPLATAQAQPEDYLESSEKLLRSLAQEEGNSPGKKTFIARLLTPTAVGSILLLLLSSATVTYIFTNPSTLTALRLNRFLGLKTPKIAQSSTQTPVAKVNPPQNSPIVEGPNLASEEFTEVNLNTLSQLVTSPTPSASPSPVPALPNLRNPGATSTVPSVVPNSALPGGSSDLSSALLPPSVQPGVGLQKAVPPVVPLPASSANTSSSTSAAQNPSSGSAKAVGQKSSASQSPASVVSTNYYYVLLKSADERTLEEVRKVIPDAYVDNFPMGTRISVGAFQLESEAKTLVEQLKHWGIPAGVYHP